MKYWFYCLFVASFLGNSSIGFSNSPEVSPYKIIGQVVEQNEETTPVEFATVTLLSVSDSSVITGTTTDPDGTFELNKVEEGNYFIKISFIGFEDSYTEPFSLTRNQKTQDLGIISLNTGETLDEVVITGQKSLIETRLDRRVFNASADITSQSGTGLTLLNNVPGVEIDMDDNITLRGSGNVQILINGRPSTFSPNTFLQQIPASSIDRIEIITNPSAKFDPEGTAGIINVILKEEEKRGFHGVVNGTFQQGQSSRYNGSVGLNYRTPKWNTSLNYSYTNNEYSYSGTNQRTYQYSDTLFVIDQYDEGIRGRNGHNLGGGIDYILNPENTIYISGNFQDGGRTGDRKVNYENYDKFGNLSSFSERKTDATDEGIEFFINAGWQKKFDKEGHKLDVDLTYSQEDEREYEVYEENIFSEDGQEIGQPELQNIDANELEGIFVGMIDYELPMSNDRQFQAGLRSDIMTIDNDFYSESFNYEENKFEEDIELNNRFIYDQNVIAAYFTYGQEIGKYSYQVGLRGEQTFTKSDLQGEDAISRDYMRLFPTLHNSYKYSETGEIMLSYSRRLNRPRPWHLNPFTNYNDPLSLRRGNPFLLPEDIHSFELGVLQYINDFTINGTLFYRLTNDVIQRFTIAEDDSPVTISTRENLGQEHAYGMEGIINYAPYRWWTINTTVNANAQSLKNVNREGITNLNSLRLSVNFNSQWRLENGWNFQLNGRYRAPFDIPQGRIESYYYINVAMEKSFMDDQLSIGLSVRDVFNTRSWNMTIEEQSGLTQVRKRNWDSRIIGLDINFRFGNVESDRKKDRRGDSGDFVPEMD